MTVLEEPVVMRMGKCVSVLAAVACWALGAPCFETALGGGQPPHRVLNLFLSAHDPGARPATPNPGPKTYPDLPTPPPEYEQAANPVLTGSARLWIWARPVETDVYWETISFNIDADGPVVLSNVTLFNPNHWASDGRAWHRWVQIWQPARSADGTEYNNGLLTSFASGYGI